MEISRLKETITEYQTLYSRSEVRCSTLEGQLKELLEELEHKAPSLSAQRENYEKLILAYNDVKNHSLILEETDKSNKIKIELLENSIVEEREQKEPMRQQNKELSRQVITLKAQVQKLEMGTSNPFQTLIGTDQAQMRNAELQNIISENAKLKIELAGCKDELSELKSRYGDVKSNADAPPPNTQILLLYTRQRSELDELRTNLDARDLEISSLTHKLTTLQQSHDTLTTTLANKQLDLDRAQRERIDLDSRQSNHNHQISAKDIELKKKSDRISELTHQIQTVKTEQVQMQLFEKEVARKKLAELESRLRYEWNLERQKLEATVHELQLRSRTESLQHELSTVKSMYEHLQSQYAALHISQEQLQYQWNTSISEVVQLSHEKIFVAKEQIQEQQEIMNMAHEDYLMNRYLVYDLDEQLSTTQIDLDNVTVENTSIAEDKEVLQSENETITSERDGALQELQTFKASLENTQQALASAQDQLAASSAEAQRLAPFENEASALRGQLSLTQAGAEKIKSEVESQINALKEVNSKIENEKQYLIEQINSLNTEKDSLQESLTALEQQLERQKSSAQVSNEAVNRLLSILHKKI